MEFESSTPHSKEPAIYQCVVIFKARNYDCMKNVITVCRVSHCALNPALAILIGFTKSTDGSVTRQKLV